MILAPAKVIVNIRFNKWTASNLTPLNDETGNHLLIKAISKGGYRAPPIHALFMMSLADQKITGRFYKLNQLSIIGITDNYVWVIAKRNNVIALNKTTLKKELNVTQQLEKNPELAGLIKSIKVDGNNDDLRIEAHNGYQYSFHPITQELKQLTSPPPKILPNYYFGHVRCSNDDYPTPKTIDGKLVLNGQWLCDDYKHRVIQSNGGKILIHRTFTNDKGTLLISNYDAVNNQLI